MTDAMPACGAADRDAATVAEPVASTGSVPGLDGSNDRR